MTSWRDLALRAIGRPPAAAAAATVLACVLGTGCSPFTSLGDLFGGGADDPPPPVLAADAGAEASAGRDRIDTFGFGPPSALASTLAGPRSLALVGDEVIVALYEGGQVLAVPKVGGAPRVLVDGKGCAPPLEVFATSTTAVWACGSVGYEPLWHVPRGGGAVTSFGNMPANAPKVVHAAEDAASYFVAYQYFAQAGIARLQKSTPQWFPVTTKENSTFSSLAADGLRVYVGTPDDVEVTSVAGGTLEVFAANQKAPTDLATDETHVYWLTASGEVVRLAKDKPGGAPEVLAAGQPALARLVLDGPLVHFTLGGGAVGDGAVRTVPKVGGAVKELARGLRGPAGLAVDATGLYVAVHDDGTVLRLAR